MCHLLSENQYQKNRSDRSYGNFSYRSGNFHFPPPGRREGKTHVHSCNQLSPRKKYSCMGVSIWTRGTLCTPFIQQRHILLCLKYRQNTKIKSYQSSKSNRRALFWCWIPPNAFARGKVNAQQCIPWGFRPARPAGESPMGRDWAHRARCHGHSHRDGATIEAEGGGPVTSRGWLDDSNKMTPRQKHRAELKIRSFFLIHLEKNPRG